MCILLLFVLVFGFSGRKCPGKGLEVWGWWSFFEKSSGGEGRGGCLVVTRPGFDGDAVAEFVDECVLDVECDVVEGEKFVVVKTEGD